MTAALVLAEACVDDRASMGWPAAAVFIAFAVCGAIGMWAVTR